MDDPLNLRLRDPRRTLLRTDIYPCSKISLAILILFLLNPLIFYFYTIQVFSLNIERYVQHKKKKKKSTLSLEELPLTL